MKRNLFFAALAVIVAVASPVRAAAPEPNRLKVTILSTNDVHGYIEPCG